MSVSFVIAHKHLEGREGRLERLVGFLHGTSLPGQEVIVSDQSGYMAESVQGMITAYVWEPRETFNKAKALNRGIAISNNPWLCVIDSDIIPEPHFCQLVQEAAEYLEPPAYCTFQVYEEDGLHYDPPKYWGSDLQLFDRGTWQATGGYREEFEGYGYEDVAYCDDCLAAGVRLKELPIAVRHDPHSPVKGVQEALARNLKIYEGLR